MIGAIYRKIKKLTECFVAFLGTTPAMNFAVQQYYREKGETFRVAQCASDLGFPSLRVLQCVRILKKNGLLALDEFHRHCEVPSSTPGKVYFRTIFYAPLELRYIKMNLYESFPYIDKFIVLEGNRTHVGEEREFIFENFIDQIPTELRCKLVYIPADLSAKTINCLASKDGTQMHKNEAELWSAFEDYITLYDNDIVIATDADEILYRDIYPAILKKLKPNGALFLPLHQFFYRMNYLWEDVTFWAPTVAFAGFYRSRPRPHCWRYEGTQFPFMAGCHFSWQLTIEEMVFKLKTYAHADIYGHLADPDILAKAVREKTYPFEPRKKFFIKELDFDMGRLYYPDSFYVYRDDFTHLLPTA